MKQARTLQDIENHPFVDSTHTEWDGCFVDSLGRELKGRWVYLKTGYISPHMECGTIHESSIKACCELLNDARRMTEDEFDTCGYTLEEIDRSRENWDCE